MNNMIIKSFCVSYIFNSSLVMIIPLTFLFCVFHGHCWRTVKGNISRSDISVELKVVLKMNDQYGSQYFHDTLGIDSSGQYTIPERLYAVNECHNGDCRETLPNSIQIIVKQIKDAKILADTTINCSELKYIGNDIELPTLNIQ